MKHDHGLKTASREILRQLAEIGEMEICEGAPALVFNNPVGYVTATAVLGYVGAITETGEDAEYAIRLLREKAEDLAEQNALPDGWFALSDERWRDYDRVLLSCGAVQEVRGKRQIVIAQYSADGWLCDGGGYYQGAKIWRPLPSVE